MRTSQILIPTLREDPGEAETVSHRLMLRAGMIRKVAAGIYTYLPLGLRVIRKIEQIVRQEMNRAGACGETVKSPRLPRQPTGNAPCAAACNCIATAICRKFDWHCERRAASRAA